MRHEFIFIFYQKYVRDFPLDTRTSIHFGIFR